jgi:hypothetical protein
MLSGRGPPAADSLRTRRAASRESEVQCRIASNDELHGPVAHVADAIEENYRGTLLA